jgi:hypothetical protein
MATKAKHGHKVIAQREREREARQPKGYRMATTAIHKMGDISRDEPSLCYIRGESGDDYIGEWQTGYGFIDVRFPKATTRKLTPEEHAKYSGLRRQIGGIVTDPRVIPDCDVEWPADEEHAAATREE